MRPIEAIWEDVRFGCRQLAASPRFAAVTIPTVASGIGACTAMFSVVNGVLLRPLDYPDPNRPVLVCESDLRKGDIEQATPGAYLEWARQATVSEGLSFSYGRSYKLTVGDRSRRLNALCVTASYFPT